MRADVKEEMDALYKLKKPRLEALVHEVYLVVDTRHTPKDVLVSMLLEANFGRKAMEE